MILGIDPGVQGGMALLLDGGAVVETRALSDLKEEEIRALLAQWKSLGTVPPVVWIEKVGHIKGDGAGGSFTFGRVYGFLRGVVRGLGMTPRDVYPMFWQAALGCMTGGNKNVSKRMAIQLFPDHHNSLKRGITHAIADAMLIAEYGRRVAGRATENRQRFDLEGADL